MEILKLVAGVLSVLGGTTLIVRLHVASIRQLINANKEQQEKEYKETKDEFVKANDNIRRLYDTKVDKELCLERCKK